MYGSSQFLQAAPCVHRYWLSTLRGDIKVLPWREYCSKGLSRQTSQKENNYLFYSSCAQMHAHKKETHAYVYTMPCSGNAVNILLLPSASSPSSCQEQQDTTTKTVPAITVKPCELLKWAVCKNGRKSHFKMLDISHRLILLGWELLFVVERVFACDFPVSPRPLNKENSHASLETRELLTLSDCLTRPNGDKKDTSTQAFARRDARTLKYNTLLWSYCPIRRMQDTNQTESVTSENNCYAFRRLQDETP